MDKKYFTDDEIDIIATSLKMTIISAELATSQGKVIDLGTREVLQKCKDLLDKLEKDFY